MGGEKYLRLRPTLKLIVTRNLCLGVKVKSGMDIDSNDDFSDLDFPEFPEFPDEDWAKPGNVIDSSNEFPLPSFDVGEEDGAEDSAEGLFPAVPSIEPPLPSRSENSGSPNKLSDEGIELPPFPDIEDDEEEWNPLKPRFNTRQERTSVVSGSKNAPEPTPTKAPPPPKTIVIEESRDKKFFETAPTPVTRPPSKVREPFGTVPKSSADRGNVGGEGGPVSLRAGRSPLARQARPIPATKSSSAAPQSTPNRADRPAPVSQVMPSKPSAVGRPVTKPSVRPPVSQPTRSTPELAPNATNKPPRLRAQTSPKEPLASANSSVPRPGSNERRSSAMSASAETPRAPVKQSSAPPELKLKRVKHPNPVRVSDLAAPTAPGLKRVSTPRAEPKRPEPAHVPPPPPPSAFAMPPSESAFQGLPDTKTNDSVFGASVTSPTNKSFGRTGFAAPPTELSTRIPVDGYVARVSEKRQLLGSGKKVRPIVPGVALLAAGLIFLVSKPVFSVLNSVSTREPVVVLASVPKSEVFDGEVSLGMTPLAMEADLARKPLELRKEGFETGLVAPWEPDNEKGPVEKVVHSLVGKPLALSWEGLPKDSVVWWEGSKIKPQDLNSAVPGKYSLKVKPGDRPAVLMDLDISPDGLDGQAFQVAKSVQKKLDLQPTVGVALKFPDGFSKSGKLSVKVTSLEAAYPFSSTVNATGTEKTSLILPSAGKYKISFSGDRSFKPTAQTLTLGDSEEKAVELSLAKAPPPVVAAPVYRAPAHRSSTPAYRPARPVYRPRPAYRPPPRRYSGGGGGGSGRIAPPAF